MATTEKNDNNLKAANEEWRNLLDENYDRREKRTAELEKKGIRFHLDGENYYKDIDDWFKAEIVRIKKKYNLE